MAAATRSASSHDVREPLKRPQSKLAIVKVYTTGPPPKKLPRMFYGSRKQRRNLGVERETTQEPKEKKIETHDDHPLKNKGRGCFLFSL